MRFYQTEDFVNLRTDASLSASVLGVIPPQRIVYYLDEEIVTDIIWIKVYAPTSNGEWKVGYVAQRTSQYILLTEFVPHVKLGTPYKVEVLVTQLFGENPQLYAGFDMNGHNGVDLATTYGTPIYAIAPGVISIGYDANGYGNYVRCEGATIITIYAHLETVVVGNNEYIQEGVLIGYQGNTGNSTGTHCHIDIRLKLVSSMDNGFLGRIDPLVFMSWEYLKFPRYSNILNSLKGT